MRLDPGRVTEGRDDVAESEKSTVDRDTLLDAITLGSSAFQLVIQSETKEGRKERSGAYPLGASKVDKVKLGNHSNPITITTLSDRISCFVIGVVKSKRTRRPETACLETGSVHGRTEAWGAGSSKGGGGNSVGGDSNHGARTSQT